VAPSTRETLVGRTVAGKYAIEALLGSGAMGEVYKARQIALDKKIALKVMHAAVAGDPSFAERFHREAKAASRLDHPNSIRVIDFGEEPDGLTYIAMEYVEGRDLHDVIQKEWPLSGERVANILIQATSALAVAHDMGVVHRDLKPENIMVVAGTDEDGRPTDIVKVLDFGIAKIMDKSGGAGTAGGPKTTAGLVIGTPEYMSPEQGRGEPIDTRADIYSIGVILFELLTGQVPFSAETPIGTVVKHLTDEPPVPSGLNPAIDRRLEAICLKAMQKKRDERYQNARELRAALRAVVDEPPSSVSVMPAAVAPTMIGMPEAPPTRILSAPQASRAATAHVASAPAKAAAWPRWVGLALLAAAIFGGTRFVVSWLHDRDSPPSPIASATASAALLHEPGPDTAATAVTVVDPATTAGASTVSPHAVPQGTPHSVPTTAPPNTTAVPPSEPAFQPSQGNAAVRVANVTGASEEAVKAALPLGSYRACYQDELRRTKKRIEGHADLKVAFKSSGSFSTAQGLAPPDLSKVGQCCADATARTPKAVQNVDPNGGTAEITIVYSIE